MARLKVGIENNIDIELHYQDYGKGRPVVLIHDWPLGSRSWENQLPALIGAGYRVITYDRRGFGGSSQPWLGYDYDTLAADLEALLVHLDLRETTLVGFSMGGGEVARYMGRFGASRVAKVVFASSITPCLYKSSDNPEGVLDDKMIASVEQGLKKDRPAFIDTFFKKFYSPGKHSELISEPQHEFQVMNAAFASPKATLDCMFAFSKTDFRADLKKVSVPALILHGDSDNTVPFEASGKRTHAAIPNSKLVLLKGAPHGCIATHSEEFNKALLGFIAG